MRRTTSFGVGTRFKPHSRNSQSPPPNSYTLPSAFEPNFKTARGLAYTFGITREAYAKVYVPAHPAKDQSVPGPGTYETRSVPGKNMQRYTFRPKTTGRLTDDSLFS